ncbi:recombination regulator RecX [Edaphovirga cremea]|uniref:recombination regulator RecX n=1 Tax=Edaphovirga cremea TaxID=2267246 RepID=UPI000DEEEF9C|nr:recombination regulator RecX [Edaphovirga cremea]
MAALLSRAMRLLSQRDHSESELRRKLAEQPFSVRLQAAQKRRDPPENPSSEKPSLEDREINPEWIDQVIEYCYQHDWLDDTRFALSYLRSRSRKGYGVQRIRSELMQKGVEKEIVSTALETCELDWCKLAKEVAERKFGDSLPTEWHEKAKVQRYLLYRGFFQEEIQSIYRDFDE